MSGYNSISIYYFSGTGNARQVARWFSHFAALKEMNVSLNDISEVKSKDLPPHYADTLIIIISPVHGFNFPKITLDFIRHFPAGKNDLVLMNTRAGMKIGKFVTPGLTGVAFMLSSLWLMKKGYRIKGQIPFDMPSNWISIHPALNENSVKFLHEKNYAKAQKYSDKIFNGNGAFPALRDILQDILISPVSLLYYLFGKYIFAKSFYASVDCDNCSVCIRKCPVDAIIIKEERPYWTFSCESCMKCMNSCPEKAIETSHGLLVAVWFISSAINSWLLYNIFTGASENALFDFILSSIIFFGLMWLTYRLQQPLLGKRWIGKIIRFTSLTGYKFWGRYKSIPDYKWMKK